MNLKELILKLKSKPDQDTEVQFVVWTATGDIVCMEMEGAATKDLMKVFAKHAPKERK